MTQFLNSVFTYCIKYYGIGTYINVCIIMNTIYMELELIAEINVFIYVNNYSEQKQLYVGNELLK